MAATTMLPTKEELKDDVIVVAVLDVADSMGHSPFWAWWYDPKTLSEGGPPDHVRGQRFTARLDEFVRRSAEQGMTVKAFNETSARMLAALVS